MWLYHRVMSPKEADRMANSVDPDQTAPWSDCSPWSSLIWVYTVCPDLSVRKLRNITVVSPYTRKTNETSYHAALFPRFAGVLPWLGIQKYRCFISSNFPRLQMFYPKRTIQMHRTGAFPLVISPDLQLVYPSKECRITGALPLVISPDLQLVYPNKECRITGALPLVISPDLQLVYPSKECRITGALPLVISPDLQLVYPSKECRITGALPLVISPDLQVFTPSKEFRCTGALPLVSSPDLQVLYH